jgi:hypothetical protein
MTFYNDLQPKILQEILDERNRQHKRRGEQEHPMLDTPFIVEGMVRGQDTYKRLNDKAENCWFQILMEEVYEAFSETSPEKQREELVQVAAVVVQILEWIDRMKNNA